VTDLLLLDYLSTWGLSSTSSSAPASARRFMCCRMLHDELHIDHGAAAKEPEEVTLLLVQHRKLQDSQLPLLGGSACVQPGRWAVRVKHRVGLITAQRLVWLGGHGATTLCCRTPPSLPGLHECRSLVHRWCGGWAAAQPQPGCGAAAAVGVEGAIGPSSLCPHQVAAGGRQQAGA
jgi:hypothetical protein